MVQIWAGPAILEKERISILLAHFGVVQIYMDHRICTGILILRLQANQERALYYSGGDIICSPTRSISWIKIKILVFV